MTGWRGGLFAGAGALVVASLVVIGAGAASSRPIARRASSRKARPRTACGKGARGIETVSLLVATPRDEHRAPVAACGNDRASAGKSCIGTTDSATCGSRCRSRRPIEPRGSRASRRSTSTGWSRSRSDPDGSAAGRATAAARSRHAAEQPVHADARHEGGAVRRAPSHVGRTRRHGRHPGPGVDLDHPSLRRRARVSGRSSTG